MTLEGRTKNILVLQTQQSVHQIRFSGQRVCGLLEPTPLNIFKQQLSKLDLSWQKH